jgi:hypothetical protein
MLSDQLISFMLFGYTLFCNCFTAPEQAPFERNRGAYKVKAYARLQEGLRESSGLIRVGDGQGSFWTHQDSGNPSFLYRIEADGSISDTLKLALPNQDWESLTKDREGNLFMGDFGNNFHNRQNLRIFRISAGSPQADTIYFSYPDQESFPPEERKELNFDCEAFFWHQNRLHLFSKSWGNRIVKHYSVPDSAGQYVARLEEELPLRGFITGAALRPDGRELALLAYGRIYLFKVSDEQEGFLQQPYKCISLAGRIQTEAITYLNNRNMLLTNEQGRLLYVYQKEE